MDIHLASVPERQILALRRGAAPRTLEASRVVKIAYAIGDYTYVQPLAWFVRFALARGLPIDPAPRAWGMPAAHDPDNVRALAENLVVAYERAVNEGPITIESGPDDAWSRAEIKRIIGLFRFAAKRGDAVVVTRWETFGAPPEIESARPRAAWEIAIGGAVALGLGLCWWRLRRLRSMRA
ncbi:MAG: hypothetical protein KF819_29075 [Labilithrix sp.]|nr:hypothetical protein [Labilithrix sp.]